MLRKLDGTSALVVPSHATKAGGPDAWAAGELAVRADYERRVGALTKMQRIAANLGRIRLAARRGRLGQISEATIAQLEQQAQELAQELRGA